MTQAQVPQRRSNKRGLATRRDDAGRRGALAGLGRPGRGVGNPDCQGERRYLGCGAVSVRRRRRVLGSRAAPHRRAPRRDVLGVEQRRVGRPATRAGWCDHRHPVPRPGVRRFPRDRESAGGTPPRATTTWNVSIRVPLPNCSPGAKAGKKPARTPSPVCASTRSVSAKWPRSSPVRCVGWSPSASSARTPTSTKPAEG